MRALRKLQAGGVTQQIGLSNVSLHQLRETETVSAHDLEQGFLEQGFALRADLRYVDVADGLPEP